MVVVFHYTRVGELSLIVVTQAGIVFGEVVGSLEKAFEPQQPSSWPLDLVGVGEPSMRNSEVHTPGKVGT